MYYFLWFSKSQWELIYYVAFVMLTLGLLVLAVKTYFFQTKKTSELFCKCIESNRVDYHSNIFLEVFNYGNTISKNIKVEIQGADFGVIPFLKPNESYMVCFGYFMHTLGGKRVNSNRFIIADDNMVKVLLRTEDLVQACEIDISILMTTTMMSELSSRPLEKIADNIKNVANALQKR